MKRRIYEAIKESGDIEDDGIKFCASPEYREAFYNRFRASNRYNMGRLGVSSPDDFLGYDGQPDRNTWFPAAPLSRQEIDATLDVLNDNGITVLNDRL